MSERMHAGSDRSEQERQARRELRSYVWGIGLALILTLVPFALVYQGDAPRMTVFVVIGVFALVQMIVHFRFFLHIGLQRKRDDLLLILFSGLLLAIMIGGTLWIMGNLTHRMLMP